MQCQWCQEPLAENEKNPKFPYLDMHIECSTRVIMGNISHLKGLCRCFVPGSKLSDPPGLSRREAAKAVSTYIWSLTPQERQLALFRRYYNTN